MKIRAAQLNGCAFCLKLHIRDAIEHGETPDRLAVVPVWWESQYFLEQERAALQIASTSSCSATMGGFLRSASPLNTRFRKVSGPAAVATSPDTAVQLNLLLEVEAVQLHDLGPRGHEVVDELLPGVFAGVDLGKGAQL